jgi:hypothetical protein
LLEKEKERDYLKLKEKLQKILIENLYLKEF